MEVMDNRRAMISSEDTSGRTSGSNTRDVQPHYHGPANPAIISKTQPKSGLRDAKITRTNEKEKGHMGYATEKANINLSTRMYRFHFCQFSS